MRKLASILALILLPTPLLAMEASFSGPRPAALEGRTLSLGTGAEPFEPGTFAFPDATSAVFKPAEDDEDASPAHPQYRFEWLNKDKSSAQFFPVTPAEQIATLRKLNDAATTTNEGKVLENSIVMAYINKGAVIRDCMNNDWQLPEAVTLYVTLTPGQAQASAVVLPEGRLAECVLASTGRGTYPAVKGPTTARMRIAVAREPASKP